MPMKLSGGGLYVSFQAAIRVFRTLGAGNQVSEH